MTDVTNIERIAKILKVVGRDPATFSISDIVKKAQLGRSTGFELIRALKERGYLEETPRKTLQLGKSARSLGLCQIESHSSKFHFGVPRMHDDQVTTSLDLAPELFQRAQPIKKAPPGPWRLGFANASSSNPWRAALLNSVYHSIKVHSSEVSEILYSDAQDDPVVQLSQIDELIDTGIDALLISAAPDKQGLLTDRLQDLTRQGLPVIAVDRRPSDKDCFTTFVTASDELLGRFSALWLAEHLKGKGRVWLLSGIQNASPTQRRLKAAKKVLRYFPDIVLEAHRYTDWTANGGYEASRNLLKVYRSAPHGVWCDSGLQGVGSIRAFMDAKEIIPPHTGGDINGMFRLALKQKISFCAFDFPAAMGSKAIDVAVSLLEGHSLPRRIEVPVAAILPRGAETRSIKADVIAEKYVRWDLADDVILSQGVALRGSGT
ncbi:MAG: substrate-binding domain-containing protein [Cohaesibacter sp.]|nr:substrate-binding domain-containing protein [Cohaesibacter sp.]